MTTVRPAPAVPAPPAPAAPLVPASCRVSLLVGESHQIDVVLPAAVPVSALTEATRDAVNRVLRSRGEDELPSGVYEFAHAAGMTGLSGEASLAAQGVADGQLLVLAPAGAAQRYGPTIENVSTALARWAAEHFPTVSARDALVVGAGLCGAALGIAALLVWRMRWAGAEIAPPVAFAAAAAVLAGSALLCYRLGAPAAVGGGAAWAGLAAMALAGACAPPGPHPGAPHAFLAAAVLIAGAPALARCTGGYQVGAAAAVTVGATVGGVAAVRMFWPVASQRLAVVVLIAVLVAARIAPTLGLWMARVPRQSFGSITGRDLFARAPGQPEDTISPVESAPHDVTLRGEQVAQLARRSNPVLAGVLAGVGVIEVGASIVAITPGRGPQWPAVAVTAVVALILVLRARGFRDRRHAITTVVAAALSLLAIPAHYGLAAPAASGVGWWAAGAVLGVAGAALTAGAVVPAHVFSPPIREAVEYLEYVLVALVVPFAAWAIGLLHYVRYH